MSAPLSIPCQVCNGDGFVSFEDRHVENSKEACWTCRGYGTVPARTGQTPQTSAAPDGELHPDHRRHTRPLPAVVSPHSGD